ncbi:SDR family NAD(P)-dependent oxidoreductase [Nocardia tengchongensis]|uniref:SDR family NAD(P)-dependent oxidoreductase n=1 Tax=Nocardia tengchongensis TaxID=2055889 RepID=UPI0036948331
MTDHSFNSGSIAITGIGCRFPGAATAADLWRLLENGGDSITEVPPDRFDIDAFYSPIAGVPGTITTRFGGFLPDVTRFDNTFFSLSPRESARMDPQHRLLLEVAWEALEDAGEEPGADAAGRKGVYIGLINNDYKDLLLRRPEFLDAHASAGVANAMASGRVSFALGFEGPSLTVDTACSSSLVAVHSACADLLSGTSDLALAGGVNIVLTPEPSICFAQSGMLASDGHCKFGDASADGFVRSEGCGIVVLERLEDAVAAGKHIYAVIAGSAVNNDGRSGGGLQMTPSSAGQAAVIRAACAKAGVAPSDLQYIEAHGTGTAVGDPIEIETLGRVVSEQRRSGEPCLLGSVKTNIGHTESAAGIAGLIKVALSIHHRRLPASLHLRTPNPGIAWDEYPIEINGAARDWPDWEGRLLAGVNSFGLSGTNAHVVLAGSPTVPSADPIAEATRPVLLPVTAPTAGGLHRQAERLAQWLRSADGVDVPGLARTLSRYRTHHRHRAVVVGRSTDDLSHGLDLVAAGTTRPNVALGVAGEPGKVVFVFPGQGSQWAGMGAELWQRDAVFRTSIERCDAVLRSVAGWSLIEELTKDPAQGLPDRLDIVQPMLFAVQVALAETWRSWDIEPDAVIGHSMGEVAAAHIAGRLSLEDAVQVICLRSRLAARIAGRGAMATAEVSRQQAAELVAAYPDRLAVAVCNSPSQTVISGDVDAIDEVLAQLEARGLQGWRIDVDFASHCPQIDEFEPEFAAQLAGITPLPGTFPFYSTVLGRALGDEQLDAAYWFANMRSTVLFWDGVEQLVADGCHTLLEISPHPALLGAVQPALAAAEFPVQVLPSGRRERELESMLSTAGALFTQGRALDWSPLQQPGAPIPLLPVYAWEPNRHWLPEDTGSSRRSRVPGRHSWAEKFSAAVTLATRPEIRIADAVADLGELSYLADHRVGESAVLPATCYLTAVLGAGGPGTELTDVDIAKALFLTEDRPVDVQLVIERKTPETAEFSFCSAEFGQPSGTPSWTEHCTGGLRTAEPDAAPPLRVDLAAIRARITEPVAVDEFYADLGGFGLHYGPGFQGVVSVHRGAGEAFGRIEAPAGIADRADIIHPAVFDACLQVVGVCELSGQAASGQVFLPVGVERLRHFGGGREVLYSHVVRRPESTVDSPLMDVRVYDEAGDPVLEALGLRLREVGGAQQTGTWRVEDSLLELAWAPGEAAPEPVERSADGAWMLLTDASGAGRELADRLTGLGAVVSTIERGDRFEIVEPGLRYRVVPGSTDDLAAAIADFGQVSGRSITDVVHLWNLDVSPAADLDAAALAAAELLGPISLLTVVHALGETARPRITMVTQGAHALDTDAQVAVAQAPSWGLGRVIARERPEFDCTLVDLAAGAEPAKQLDALVEELLNRDGEREIALRELGRQVARLDRTDGSADHDVVRTALPSAEPFRLENRTPGILDGLVLRNTARLDPQPGFVEINVRAAALNFIDIMSAMGVLPNYGRFEGPLGIECSGVVTAVGAGVEDFAVGDEVVAMAPNSIASYVVTNAYCVAHKPAQMTYAEGSTIPVAFLTAWYSLITLGRLAPGERVLIHSAAGGVGLAAIEICRMVGAEVFATVGTEEKREFLRARGVRHIMDSHALDWAAETMRLTDGAGVDIVLNSLAGEAIPLGIGVLAPYGRFVEIGKRDIYDNKEIGLYPFRANLSFYAVDLDRITRERPEIWGGVQREIMPKFADGTFSLLPFRQYDSDAIPDAFRFMARGQHIGKVVIDLDCPEVMVAGTAQGALLRADGTYLITGGLGGLGLLTAEWLAERGVGRLVLMGRSAPSEQTRAKLREIEVMGTQVEVARVDVTAEAQVIELLARIRETGPPLRGILHCAMVLDDGVLAELDPDRMRTAMAPKVQGIWNLHAHTASDPLALFVLFSSAASLLGSPGQGNYAAGNAFLDALAHHRRSLGLPATSINWGAWAEIGQAAQDGRDSRLGNRGIGSMTPAQGLEALEAVIMADPVQVAVLNFDVARWAQLYPSAAASPFYSRLVDDVPQAGGDGTGTLIRRALRTGDRAEATAALAEFLREAVARVIGIQPGELSVDTELTRLGIDSLMAVELRNKITAELRVELLPTVLLKGPTVVQLEQQILALLDQEIADSGTAEVIESETPLDPARAEELLERIDELSDTEVEALLADLAASGEATE